LTAGRRKDSVKKNGRLIKSRPFSFLSALWRS
jgi:hypothetical protein